MPKYAIMTMLVLTAIPVVLFSELRMDGDFVRTITNLAAMCLIFFAWQIFEKQKLFRIDKLLVRTYLLGLLSFSIWMGINLIIVSTYESSWRNNRDASIRSYCLHIEPFLVGFGAASAFIFAILCVIRIILAIRNRTRSLKATHV